MDTDLLGQLTMQQAVMRVFPTATAKVRFTNRSEDMNFTKECTEILKGAVASERLKSITPSLSSQDIRARRFAANR
jgi:hypothetical protein